MDFEPDSTLLREPPTPFSARRSENITPSSRRTPQENFFLPRGSAQPVEKARFGQGNPRKSKPFSWKNLVRSLAGFAGFG
jgi:hypothetical protein